jgi:hypothetical protein
MFKHQLNLAGRDKPLRAFFAAQVFRGPSLCHRSGRGASWTTFA